MAKNTAIEWTESTWNPITGCNKVSDGCLNCYAEKLAYRLKAMGHKKYKNGFKVTLHYSALNEPLKWKKPQMIFVCSMSDIFHKDVPDDFIIQIFEVMNKAHWHIFQVLTKRADRIDKIKDKVKWTDNIWLGVTVENERALWRVKHLVNSPAKVKFLSLEPLLGDLPNLDLTGIDWVIVGGESGPGARPMKKEWVVNIRDKCKKYNVPFFFKQWGGINKKKNGRLLDGKTYDEMPKAINIFKESSNELPLFG
jgi:protein gp37